jgi:hypothetical protein
MQDHYVIDTIIWQYTHVGVEINGAANVLMGVHAWGSGCGRFTYLTGILLQGSQNRLIGCYLGTTSVLTWQRPTQSD